MITFSVCCTKTKYVEGRGCCRRKDKIKWSDHAKNERVLLRVKGEWSILHT
jgi:hypothetical protein